MISFEWAGGLLLALWPSSILMLADSEDSSFFVPFIAILLNVCYYVILTVLLFLGFRRSKIAGVFVLACIGAAYWALLAFYY